jgi:hypothetical protein
MSRGFKHVCVASIPEYKKDVTLDSVALVFRAYSCVWCPLSSETFEGLRRPTLLTSVQYSSDPVQFVSINEEICNSHCFLLPVVLHSMSQEEGSIFWEVIVSAILSKKVYMYMCPIPNGFRDRAISLYRAKLESF